MSWRTEKPLKVLWVMPSLGTGGVERMSLDLTRSLSDQMSMRVLLLKPGSRPWPAGHPVVPGVLCPADVRLRRRLPQVMARLVRTGRQCEVVVASMELDLTYLSQVAAWVARRPLITLAI